MVKKAKKIMIKVSFKTGSNFIGIQLNGTQLSATVSVEFLGVTADQHPMFSTHDIVCKELHQQTFCYKFFFKMM